MSSTSQLNDSGKVHGSHHQVAARVRGSSPSEAKSGISLFSSVYLHASISLLFERQRAPGSCLPLLGPAGTGQDCDYGNHYSNSIKVNARDGGERIRRSGSAFRPSLPDSG
jgi:hypothetical protein